MNGPGTVSLECQAANLSPSRSEVKEVWRTSMSPVQFRGIIHTHRNHLIYLFFSAFNFYLVILVAVRKKFVIMKWQGKEDPRS
jgi:hypothetical protein